MEHKKTFGAGLILLMLFTTACTGNSANGIAAKKVDGLPANSPTHLSEKLCGHVRLNADVVIPAGVKNVPVLKAELYTIDPQRLREAFNIKPFNNSETGSIRNVTIDQRPDGSTQELAFGKLLNEDGQPILMNNRLLIYGASQTIFMTTEYNYTFVAFQRDPTSGNNFIDQYTKKTLPFALPNSAFDKVTKIMNTFGLDVKGSHQTYCIDHLTSLGLVGLSAGMEYINYVSSRYEYLPGKSEWEDYDDYYYFVLYPKYHGIPIAEGDGSSIEGGTLDVAYCERGIEYLMANSLYKETGVLQPDVKIYGLDGALQMLKYKYDNTILTEPVTVSSIRFCYVPQPLSKNSKEYELIPAWQFTIKKTVMNVNGETEASNFGEASAQMETINVYFDATTGKEIIGSTPRL